MAASFHERLMPNGDIGHDPFEQMLNFQQNIVS